MRKLREHEDIHVLSSEIFSVLQLRAINEPLFPRLKNLKLWGITGRSIPFIPIFLSQRTAIIRFSFVLSNSPAAMVASMVATFPTLCPNLQKITLHPLPTDPMITTAVSEMLLANNRNILRSVHVDLPLTEEAREVISKLPNLQKLSVTVERETSVPSVVLPNLTRLTVKCDHNGDWLRMFHGATFGKLEVIAFYHTSGRIGDFLEAFERVALAASVQNTLSGFYLITSFSWNPNYSSLLPFTHLALLHIEFSCSDGCSSRVDDDIITNLAREMPGLDTLRLGKPPCREIPIGVTIKGLAILAKCCPDIDDLRIHFLVASLSAPPAIHGTTPDIGLAALRRDCALTGLCVGEIPMPEESVSVVAVTLARIFPHLEGIEYTDENWEKVADAICTSREIFDYSGEEFFSSLPRRSDFSNTSPGAALENGN